MNQIHQLASLIDDYQSLEHHQDSTLNSTFTHIQTWQKTRQIQSHQQLLHKDHSRPFALYLIERIYQQKSLDVIIGQLKMATDKAIDGSGRLNKLIPSFIFRPLILGLDFAILNIKLDLQLAKALQNQPVQALDYVNSTNNQVIASLYQDTKHQQQRLKQLDSLSLACRGLYPYLNSFLAKKGLKLIKHSAYQNGYQALYDFIWQGVIATDALKSMDDFIQTFISSEQQDLERFGMA